MLHLINAVTLFSSVISSYYDADRGVSPVVIERFGYRDDQSVTFLDRWSYHIAVFHEGIIEYDVTVTSYNALVQEIRKNTLLTHHHISARTWKQFSAHDLSSYPDAFFGKE